ncbi:hypothetical protein [Asaia sp. As-1742]|uniref:hypothetical protein n=1 Tax=Asaia sp. As-1742 TaxID=2608325 RepID=UPI0014210A36|nr:hypothetical protein [Asaia sp. As-1742]NIE79817.1 hypothetical protein [Asaia sp. As-1742]
MLKSSFVIFLALLAWGVSSLAVMLGMPNLASLTDELDLVGEILFATGILLIFVRLGLNSYRKSADSVGSPIGQTKQS